MVGVSEELLKRDLNFGFSGGEKKRNEILQMAMIEPRLCILDETDSGLDIDALRTVADGVNALRDPSRGIVVITHYQRLLDYIVPDQVHVLADGRIRRSGGKELALRARGRRLCRRAGRRVASRGGPEAMAPARTAIEPLPAYRCRLRQCRGPAARPATCATGAGRASPGSSSRASPPPGPRTGSTPTSQGGQRAAGGGAQGGDRPRCDRALSPGRPQGAAADLRQRPRRARAQPRAEPAARACGS